MQLEVLSNDLGSKMQLCTQGYNKRPYGVGMLISGYDEEVGIGLPYYNLMVL